MKVDERALQDVHTVGGGETPPCVGLTSNTLPKADRKSTRLNSSHP